MFLGNRKNLDEKMATLEKENKHLEIEIDKYKKRVAELNQEVNSLKKEQDSYRNNLIECSYCFETIKKDSQFCSNCGRRIVKKAEMITKTERQGRNLFEVEEDKEGLLITAYHGFDETIVVIPSEINGKKVIGIYNKVFMNCRNLEQVVIQEGCQYIGYRTFFRCESLHSVLFPKSMVEVGNEAFWGCVSLEEIIIPSGVKVLGNNIFSHCTKLKSIVLPTELECIPQGAFESSGIEEICVPHKVKVIMRDAFKKSAVRDIFLPEGLQVIEEYAFFDCNELKEITIFSNVRVLGQNCFSYDFTQKDLTVYCTAGSVVQQMLRDYEGIICKEIKPVEKSKNSILGYKRASIHLGNNHYGSQFVDYWVNVTGISKATTWAWDFLSMNWFLYIDKYILPDEKLKIEQSFAKAGLKVSFEKFN